jgi:hypothetical protein
LAGSAMQNQKQLCKISYQCCIFSMFITCSYVFVAL